MSATDRQNRLLVAEDWKRVYQSFRNADFQSYDFENLRRVMISYIRENYPEDFNDYIESSEYLALIDLIAFLGQSISFRVDLNARENFLELAERRESVLRLARLLSYNAKRNRAGNGLLKFSTVSTTETIVDSNGRNIANQTILWNDPTNANWYEQFIKVINAALNPSRQFGNPDIKDTIYGVPTEQYRVQGTNVDVPIFGFTKNVDGRNMKFELVSTIIDNELHEIKEEPPALGNKLAFIYRDDGRGAGSASSGFFIHFRQGSTTTGSFDITQPGTNEIVDIDAANINDTDVWLYRLDKNGIESELWDQVPSFEGNNVIYNSLNKSIKNIFGVVTRVGDRISLVFSDGTFGNLPLGSFRVYYRVSNGLAYTINPKDIRGVTLSIPYLSHTRQVETLTVTLSLQSSVTNASAAESSSSIKLNAPANYYTQNRMITGEDYNISPLSISQDVLKVKAVNRSSSGISRYFDLVDPTGKYSKTNLFSDDGVLYREEYTDSFKFSYATKSDIEYVIYNEIFAQLKKDTLKNFYYKYHYKDTTQSVSSVWYQKTVDTNQSTGYIGDSIDAVPYPVGFTSGSNSTTAYTSTDLKFIESGAIVKFIAPTGYVFDKTNNNILQTQSTIPTPNTSNYIWSKIISVTGNGTANNTGELSDGSGPIVLNDVLPSGVGIAKIIPKFKNFIDSATINTMIDLIFANKPFGLRYDTESRSWKIIFEANLNLVDSFSLGKQGDKSNQQLDASWLLLFTTDNEYYTVKTRLLRYIFESDQQIRFYFDSSDKIYDTRNNTIVKDKIKILSINTDPASAGEIQPFTFDKEWEILEEFRGLDGYVDTKKIEVTFADSDEDGCVDDPEIFDVIINTASLTENKYVLQQKYQIGERQEDYKYVENTNYSDVIILDAETNLSSLNLYKDGQYFYFKDKDVVKQLNLTTSTLNVSLDYKVYVGRDNLKFQYIHNADYESRIDPAITNIIDIFVLTKQYDLSFRQWLLGSIEQEPLPPSSDSLYNTLSVGLNKIKSLSDEIIYHPVRYKVLFGKKASYDVQATFKIVKNNEQVISDNDVKSKTLAAINEFFSIENWEFGDKFYFSELSAYVMAKLTPYITNFLIVPKKEDLSFGSLYEINSESDQIFINGATVEDIEIISGITASNIKSSGSITNSPVILNQQNITSARIGDY